MEVNNERRDASGDVPVDAGGLVGGVNIEGVVGPSDVAYSEPGATVAYVEEASEMVEGASERGD